MGQRASAKKASDDVKRQIDSGNSAEAKRPIYQLVDVKTGGGRLIELVKARARQQSGSGETTGTASLDDGELDAHIRRLVEPLLYAGGCGKLVPLAHLWAHRLGCTNHDSNKKRRHERRPSSSDEEHAPCRRVCWKLEERGFVGETALHICFLLSTPSHMILARKLLTLFPALIEDTYTCDEYFGESSLHMAIVNEDVRIVRFLLDHGARVHARCLGSFFLPHDQKTRANLLARRQLDSNRPLTGYDLEANHFSSLQTNYDGYTYWGEYPLSFAASLGLVDCYKLLLAKGANPNRADSNGNTTLHICVIADRLDMFDLCYSHGANLESRNKLGLSPLALAARLCRVRLFFHILTIRRQVSWLFCNVAFLDFPLAGIDSLDGSTGASDHNSLLAIVVSGNSNEHLQMLDGLLADLLQVKWDSSLKRRFCAWLALFLVLLLVAGVAYVTRFANHQERARFRRINQLSELALLACVLYYLTLLIRRCRERPLLDSTNSRADQRDEASSPQAKEEKLSSLQLKRLLAQAPELSIFTFTCFLILACVPMRLLGLHELEDSLAALIMFLLPLKLLFFCRGSKSLGSFIVMIYRILVNDVLCFVVFLVIFISGFAQSFLIVFKTYRPRDASTLATQRQQLNSNASPPAYPASESQTHLASMFESIVAGESHLLTLLDALITMHMMALNEFSWVLDEFHATDYPNLARVLFCVYMILVSILLINMLIAMLGKTYQDITSQPNENLRQWARALLTVERMCSRSARLQMLDKYTHLASRTSGDYRAGRSYSTTWALDGPVDLKQIETIERLKRDQAANSRSLFLRTTTNATTDQANQSVQQ